MGDGQIRFSQVGSLGDANGLVKVALVTCLGVFPCSICTCLECGEILQNSLAK